MKERYNSPETLEIDILSATAFALIVVSGSNEPVGGAETSSILTPEEIDPINW